MSTGTFATSPTSRSNSIIKPLFYGLADSKMVFACRIDVFWTRNQHVRGLCGSIWGSESSPGPQIGLITLSTLSVVSPRSKKEHELLYTQYNRVTAPPDWLPTPGLVCAPLMDPETPGQSWNFPEWTVKVLFQCYTLYTKHSTNDTMLLRPWATKSELRVSGAMGKFWGGVTPPPPREARTNI